MGPPRTKNPDNSYQWAGLYVQTNANGRAEVILGLALEQDGHPLLNGRSTAADVRALLGTVPERPGRGLYVKLAGVRIFMVALKVPS